MSTWTNDDGLYIKYGREEGKIRQGGSINFSGATNKAIFYLDWDNMNAHGTVTYLSDSYSIPKGAWLRSAVLYVDEAFVSATTNSTLTLGFYRQGARTTAIDADGIDATIAEAALTAGATIVCDGADVGTLIDATYDALVTATVGTATLTAGRARLELDFYTPYTPQE